jgi:AAA domain, putative AbiEii toxin, Type IV TA system/AAA ATPase domain
MLTNIHIQGFKGFKDTRIQSLRKVNLILGGQNVGKTSLLEAVYFGASEIKKAQELSAVFRATEGRDSQRFVENVFKDARGLIELFSSWNLKLSTSLNSFRTADALGQPLGYLEWDGVKVAKHLDATHVNALGKLSMVHTSAHEQLKSLTFWNPLAVSVHLPTQTQSVQLFDKVVIGRKKKQLLDMLRRIEPRLEDIHSLSPDGELRIYVELDGEGNALPLPQLGHGFSRLVFLYCSLLVTDAHLALIDEIENGIHYSSLPILFRGIQAIADKSDVQMLMTTHSWDCIRAAYKTFADAGALKDFQLIRLERDEDNVRAVVINDEALDTVMEAGYEVR